MQATRRYWAVVAVAIALIGGSIIVERPALLIGGTAIGGWLLAYQYRFIRALDQDVAGLDVTQTVTPRRVLTEDTVLVTLELTAQEPTTLTVTATADPPVAATGSTRADRSCRLAPGDATATAAFQLQTPVAGAYTVQQPQIRIEETSGLFTETLTRGPTPTVIVDPRTPRDLHIGEGGDQAAVGYGEHVSGRMGSGLEVAQLRQYVPGDAAANIDWKATARLNEMYVREFEAETDRTIALVIDHREAMAEGRDGQTKLDYAREATLGLLEHAQDLNDSVGLYAIGDGGVTARHAPKASEDHYRTLRDVLQRLAPTSSTDANPTESETRTPAVARRRGGALTDGSASAFATTLTPYFTASDAYIRRLGDDPLFAATRRQLTRLPGSVLTVIVTDDNRRAELQEAVKLAGRGDDAVLVLLTPSVLYEPGGLSDLEAAYRRYLDFEEFRRSLARLERVQAYEVGPGDRLGALLAARRDQRSTDQEVPAR
jgi:uncharacterized protein (DUF58 family)